jgi:hypothetical protein
VSAPRDYNLLPDGTIDPHQDGIDKLFEPELEEVADALAHRTPRTPQETEAERTLFERECRQWCEAMGKRVDDALRGEGIDVGRVTFNRIDAIFKINARDATAKHRDYSVEVQVADALATAELHDVGPFAAVARDVIERIRQARATYLRRMGD